MASGMAATTAAHGAFGGMAGGMTGIGSMPASAAASFGHMHPPFPHYAPNADDMVDPTPLAATASASASSSSIGSWSAQQHNDDVGMAGMQNIPIQGRQPGKSSKSSRLSQFSHISHHINPIHAHCKAIDPCTTRLCSNANSASNPLPNTGADASFRKTAVCDTTSISRLWAARAAAMSNPYPISNDTSKNSQRMISKKLKRAVSPYKHQMEHPDVPQLHYKSGPIIRMNKWQREQQKRGKLPGCVANCHVPPIGSVEPKHRRGHMMGVEFPDADEVMQEYQ